MSIISIIAMVSIVMNVAQFFGRKGQNKPVDVYRRQIDIFYKNMEKLDYDKEYSDELLKQYNTLEDLMNANRELSRQILKHYL